MRAGELGATIGFRPWLSPPRSRIGSLELDCQPRGNEEQPTKRERITSAVLSIFTDADLQKLGVKRQCGRRFCDVRHAGPGGIEAVTSVGCGVVPGNRRGCVGRQLQATEETLLTFQKVLRGAGREEGLLHNMLEDQKRASGGQKFGKLRPGG